jgi:hypothetical protein
VEDRQKSLSRCVLEGEVRGFRAKGAGSAWCMDAQTGSVCARPCCTSPAVGFRAFSGEVLPGSADRAPGCSNNTPTSCPACLFQCDLSNRNVAQARPLAQAAMRSTHRCPSWAPPALDPHAPPRSGAPCRAPTTPAPPKGAVDGVTLMRVSAFWGSGHPPTWAHRTLRALAPGHELCRQRHSAWSVASTRH